MGSSQPEQVFRPAHTKLWAPSVVGIFLALMGIGFLSLSVLIAAGQHLAVTIAVGLCGLVLTLTGAWCLWAGLGVAGAFVRISNEGLELKAQPWSLWKRNRVRAARLRWEEVHGVKLCQIDNFMMPSGTDDNYILSTRQGDFVVETTLWGNNATKIAELVAERIQQPIHRPDDAAADAQQLPSSLNPRDQLGVRLMRGFGWLCTILTCVFMALIFIALLAAKPEERLDLAKTLIYGIFILAGARALRRFKVRMG